MSILKTWAGFLHGGGAYFSSDVIFLLAMFVVFCAYALYFGRSRAISLILALYPARLLFEHFPFMSLLMIAKGGEGMILLNKILIFLIFLVLLDILISRFIFADSGMGGPTHYLRVAGYSVSLVILFLIVSYSVFSLDIIHNFSPSIDALFASPEQLFWWNLAPLALLFFL